MQRIRKSFLTLAATAGLFIGAGIAAIPATAAPVIFNFTGAISTSQFPLSTGIFTSDSVKGTFTFDNSTLASPLGSGNYVGAVSAFSMDFLRPSVVYSTSQNVGANGIVIINDSSLGGGAIGDRWQLETSAKEAGIFTDINGYTPHQFEIQLDGATGGVSSLLSSNALQTPPNIISNPDLTTNRWRVIFENTTGETRVVIGSLSTLTAVPLPPAVILFGAGLVALIGLGAGSWRKQGNSVA